MHDRDDGRGARIGALAERHHARLVRCAAAAGAGAGAEDAVQETYRALLAAPAPLPADDGALARYAVVAVRRAAVRGARRTPVATPFDEDAHGAATAVALPVERAAMAHVFLEAWYRAAATTPARAARVVVRDALDAPREEIAGREATSVRAVRRDLERHRDGVRERALRATGHARRAGPASIFGGLLVRLRELPLVLKAALVGALAVVPAGGVVLHAIAPPAPTRPAARAPMPSPRPAPPRHASTAPAPAPSPRVVRRPRAAAPVRPVGRLRPAPRTRRVPVPGIVDATRELPEPSSDAPLGDVGVPGL